MGVRRSLIVTSSKCFPISLFSFLIFQSVFSNFVLEPLQSSLLRTPLPHDISLCIVKNDKKSSSRRGKSPAAAPERHAREWKIWRPSGLGIITSRPFVPQPGHQGPADGVPRQRLLIETPKRLEIAVTLSKQTKEVLSNRDNFAP
jgi:hypothetical protein